jgi:hypothetical protein
MNCYLCLQENDVSRPALAFCRRCGAGMCQNHLVELLVRPVVGPGGNASPRYSLICYRCYRCAIPPTRLACSQRQTSEPGEQETSSGWRWWQRLWRRRKPALPTPEEAVRTVELFLKYERSRE